MPGPALVEQGRATVAGGVGEGRAKFARQDESMRGTL